jgi:hypothetical protein
MRAIVVTVDEDEEALRVREVRSIESANARMSSGELRFRDKDPVDEEECAEAMLARLVVINGWVYNTSIEGKSVV